MEASNLLNLFKNLLFSLYLPVNRQVLGRSSLSFEVGSVMVYLANNHNVEKYWKIFSHGTLKTAKFLMILGNKLFYLCSC